MVTSIPAIDIYINWYSACKVTTLDTDSPGRELQPLPSVQYIYSLVAGLYSIDTDIGRKCHSDHGNSLSSTRSSIVAQSLFLEYINCIRLLFLYHIHTILLDIYTSRDTSETREYNCESPVLLVVDYHWRW